MEFKFRAIDNINPSTMQRYLPTVTCLPDRSLPMDGGFSGSRVPLATNEAALRREMEKEQIRRDILRRMELEEEVRRELAMEGAFGTMQRPLNSVWSNSSPMLMNPVAVNDHIGASKPASIMAPPEIKHSPQTSDKDKVILLYLLEVKIELESRDIFITGIEEEHTPRFKSRPSDQPK